MVHLLMNVHAEPARPSRTLGRFGLLCLLSLAVHLALLFIVTASDFDKAANTVADGRRTIQMTLLKPAVDQLALHETTAQQEAFDLGSVSSSKLSSIPKSDSDSTPSPEPISEQTSPTLRSVADVTRSEEVDKRVRLPESSSQAKPGVTTTEVSAARTVNTQVESKQKRAGPEQTVAVLSAANESTHPIAERPVETTTSEGLARSALPSTVTYQAEHSARPPTSAVTPFAGMQMMDDAELAHAAVSESQSSQQSQRWNLIRQYLAEVERQIYSAWSQVGQWPQDLRGVIRFELDEAGRLQALYVHLGSGDARFDRSILQAVNETIRPHTEETKQLAALNYRYFRFDYNARGQGERALEFLPWQQKSHPQVN